MWCFAEDRHYFSSIKFITCRKQIVVTVTQVSEEHHFYLRPMIKNSLVFLTSKDKVLQFHFPQEERAHLFTKGIKNIWIFEHITVFSPLTCSWNPRNIEFMLTARSILTALLHLLPKIPHGRLFQTDYKQEGREFIWTQVFKPFFLGVAASKEKKKNIGSKKRLSSVVQW